jgi:hypothetical protein
MAVFADKLLEAAKRGGAAAATGGASELAESGKLKAEMGATPHPTLSPIEAERAQVFELPVGVTPARRDQIAEFLREALRQNTVTNSLGGLR